MRSNESDAISFDVSGEPASKARARFTGRGSKVRTFTPEKTRQAERAVAAAYLLVAGRTNKVDRTTAFRVTAEFHLTKHQRRDVDNMLKLVLDGLNQVAWEDDHQVVEVIGRKFYDSGDGRTSVKIESVGKIPRSESTCIRCGATFPRPPSHSAKKYCSQSCRSAALRESRTRTCLQCGGAYQPHSIEADTKFCSIPCFQQSRHIDATCVSCGKPFTKPRHLNRSGNSYCSPECKAGYWRNQRKGAAKGTCSDCGGPTSKKSYERCRDCAYASGWPAKRKTTQ